MESSRRFGFGRNFSGSAGGAPESWLIPLSEERVMVADPVNDTSSHRMVGVVLSEYRTSMSLVRYRWWEGSITVELLLLDEPTAVLAVLPAVRPSATDVQSQ
jgi:hypothetical protein